MYNVTFRAVSFPALKMAKVYAAETHLSTKLYGITSQKTNYVHIIFLAPYISPEAFLSAI
jgi:hypothetical protein